jgi:hypothetical protein
MQAATWRGGAQEELANAPVATRKWSRDSKTAARARQSQEADNCGDQAWPSRPGEQQFAWEPPRVVVDAKSQRAGGKLNPRWVETLMGLPIGWTMPSCIRPVTIAPTSCDSSGTALCQPSQSERSDFLLAS